MHVLIGRNPTWPVINTTIFAAATVKYYRCCNRAHYVNRLPDRNKPVMTIGTKMPKFPVISAPLTTMCRIFILRVIPKDNSPV